MTPANKAHTRPKGAKRPTRAPLRPQGQRQRRAIFGVVGVLVLALGSFAVLSTSPDSGGKGFVLRRASAVGTIPAYDETAATDLAVGRPAPVINGEDFTGRRVTVSAGRNPKLLLFLAHWCPHCRREVPVVTKWLSGEQAPQNADVIAIATSIDAKQPNYPPSSWLEDENWVNPVIVDGDNTVQTAFGLKGLPYWVAVKADGTVAARASGELSVGQMQAMLNAAR